MNARNRITHADLRTATFTHFEPLMKALADVDGEIGSPNAQDTGQEKRIDIGLQITLDQLCRALHRQTYGAINANNGNKIDNAEERFKKSQHDLQAITERYGDDRNGMEADPRFWTTLHWMEINTLRFDAYRELLRTYEELYQRHTGRQWKFVDATATQGRQVKPKDEERRAKLLAFMQEKAAA